MSDRTIPALRREVRAMMSCFGSGDVLLAVAEYMAEDHTEMWNELAKVTNRHPSEGARLVVRRRNRKGKRS